MRSNRRRFARARRVERNRQERWLSIEANFYHQHVRGYVFDGAFQTWLASPMSKDWGVRMKCIYRPERIRALAYGDSPFMALINKRISFSPRAIA